MQTLFNDISTVPDVTNFHISFLTHGAVVAPGWPSHATVEARSPRPVWVVHSCRPSGGFGRRCRGFVIFFLALLQKVLNARLLVAFLVHFSVSCISFCHELQVGLLSQYGSCGGVLGHEFSWWCFVLIFAAWLWMECRVKWDLHTMQLLLIVNGTGAYITNYQKNKYSYIT